MANDKVWRYLSWNFTKLTRFSRIPLHTLYVFLPFSHSFYFTTIRTFVHNLTLHGIKLAGQMCKGGCMVHFSPPMELHFHHFSHTCLWKGLAFLSQTFSSNLIEEKMSGVALSHANVKHQRSKLKKKRFLASLCVAMKLYQLLWIQQSSDTSIDNKDELSSEDYVVSNLMTPSMSTVRVQTRQCRGTTG